MFTALIVKPLFNLLVLIYALLPGHNFGLALIIFTVIIRLLLWPFLKKQLHQTKAMRKLQPDLKRIKKAAKGNRQKESMMMMELYKEKGISPFGTLPTLIIQFIILIGLYSGLIKIIRDPNALVNFAYPFLQDLSWMKHLASNIHYFDNTLFGFVDLGRSALADGKIYFPALVLAVSSGIVQYFQSKQLLPSDKDAKNLRTIMKEAGSGQQADQSEVNAAVGRMTLYFLPAIVILFTLQLASALALYWLVSGLVGYIQQTIILKEDEEELEELASDDSDDKKNRNKASTAATGGKKDPNRRRKGAKVAGRDVAAIPEAEVIETKKTTKPAAKKTSPKSKNKPSSTKKKRR